MSEKRGVCGWRKGLSREEELGGPRVAEVFVGLLDRAGHKKTIRITRWLKLYHIK